MKLIRSFSSFIFLLSICPINIQAQCLKNTEWEKIIPSENLPEQVKTMHSNNNVDIIEFKRKYYIGFRTAPNHFASKKTRMYVMSTTDFTNWNVEQEIALGSDVREPRFYRSDDTLFFMFFKGGKKKVKFEPNGIFQTHLTGGAWSELKELNLPLGYVPWRIKKREGIYYLSSYSGWSEYQVDEPCESRFFISKDGYQWDSISKEPQILHPRATAENAFVFVENGDAWGISRLEFDGSYIWHAKKGTYDKWQTWYSKHKFDSPIMFTHKGNIFLIARRNLDGDGTFYRKEGKYKKNLVRYSFKKKTTAIYLLDTLTKSLIHVRDLNSTGDCAFPGVAQVNDSTYYVLNYSSDITKRKKNWISGQLGKTYIYKSTFTIGDCKLEEFDKLNQYFFE